MEILLIIGNLGLLTIILLIKKLTNKPMRKRCIVLYGLYLLYSVSSRYLSITYIPIIHIIIILYLIRKMFFLFQEINPS